MLRKKALKKIIITTFVLFVVLTFYMIPSKKKDTNINYHYVNVKDVSVYLLNNNNQLTKVDFKVNDGTLKDILTLVICKLIKSNDDTIPAKFNQVIPNDVKILDLNIDEGIVSINFSEEFLNIKNDDIERIVEAISYSLFDFKEVTGVSLYIEGENISKYFSRKIPDIIKKDYGINKRFELKNLNDVSKVVIYYIDNIDDKDYYVPITKYVNDERDKIKIIIDELSSNYVYESNLISLLDKNIELLDYEIKNDVMTLNFNNSIFMANDDVLEEVVYSISYSVFANYDVNEVVFKVNGADFTKKNTKSY